MGIIRMLIYGLIGIWMFFVFLAGGFMVIVEYLGLTGGEMEAFAVVYVICLLILFRIAPTVTQAFESLKP